MDILPDMDTINYYVLPDLNTGNYYFATMGQGTAYFPGDSIFYSMTLYIYEANTSHSINCYDESFFHITIKYELEFPKYFSPNNDGIKDYRTIKHNRLMQDNPVIPVYNKYGALVAKLRANIEAWDGRDFSGRKLPADDYWFKVRLSSGHSIFKGHFSLIR